MKKVINCIVIKKKNKKTIKVLIKKKIKNKNCKKIIKHKINLLVHDEKNKCNIGDIILIKENKPISKSKNWIFYKIIKKKI